MVLGCFGRRLRCRGAWMAIITVPGLIDNNVRITAWCNPCRHHDVLDLDALGQRLGFDYTTMHADLTPG